MAVPQVEGPPVVVVVGATKVVVVVVRKAAFVPGADEQAAASTAQAVRVSGRARREIDQSRLRRSSLESSGRATRSQPFTQCVSQYPRSAAAWHPVLMR